jgi:diguanylate cyclase (GGDEF)-like protein/PAS domain S-box-containing protein
VLLGLYEDAIGQANTKTTEAEVARIEFDQIFDAVADPTWVVNDRYEVVRINRAFLDLLRIKEKETALSKKCYELLPSPSCHIAQCPLKHIRRTMKRLEIEEEREISPDRKVPFLMTAMPLFGLASELVGMVQHFKDITERKRYEDALKQANRELEQLAAADGLTGLANRRIFDERLHAEWMRMAREKQPFSLVLCDIDFFKKYNDYYGHQSGDACLKAVAKCIKSAVQRPGDLVARYGGEEFGILLPNTDSGGAFQLAEKIRTAICSIKLEHARSAVSDSVTICLGVATVVPSMECDEAEKLLKAADQALYASKMNGRNRVTMAPRPVSRS